MARILFPHGADYNPDQWLHQPEIIDRDFELFPQANCNSFSVGIFGWTSYEREEGIFDFDWLDHILDRLGKAGHSVMLATPSGSKPKWLSVQYPEIRRVNEQGQRERVGSRHNHCPTSPVYREKVRIINTKLAERYGKHPAVRMWHIGNEYCGECYCELCRRAFVDWARQRYGTLDALNLAWWTNFWSHQITDWDWRQVDPADHCSDGMHLDWRRFMSHQQIDFMRAEIAAVRAVAPHLPVTTNFMGTAPWIDYWEMSRHVDVVSNDAYPGYDVGDDLWLKATNEAFNFDLMRSFKGGQPWNCMEISPSIANWYRIAKLKSPGIHHLEAMQQVSHGADGIHYFQWRKGRGGFEKYHGAILDHDGRAEHRVFQEVAQLGTDLQKLVPVLGARTAAEIGVVYDWEANWAEKASAIGRVRPDNLPWGGGGHVPGIAKDHYRGLWQNTLPTRFVHPDGSDLASLRLLLVPGLFMLRRDFAARLRAWVEAGGIVVGSNLLGAVDDNNRNLLGGTPGDGLTSVFGVHVEEIDQLDDHETLPIEPLPDNALGLSGAFTANLLCDRLVLQGAEVLATYGAGRWYAQAPVITAHRCGKGLAYYVGTCCRPDFHRAFYAAIAKCHGLAGVLPEAPPVGVSARLRENSTERFLFVQNFTGSEALIRLPQGSWLDHLAGAALADERLTIAPYTTRILAQPA